MKDLFASDIMNTNVLSVGLDWSIDQLSDFFVENAISGAPVISENGELHGVVSLSDIVRYKSIPASDLRSADIGEYQIHCSERKYSPAEIDTLPIEAESLITVREIMTPITFNVKEETSIQQVADAMLRGRIHRVFVTRGDKLIGIITTMDILRTIRDM